MWNRHSIESFFTSWGEWMNFIEVREWVGDCCLLDPFTKARLLPLLFPKNFYRGLVPNKKMLFLQIFLVINKESFFTSLVSNIFLMFPNPFQRLPGRDILQVSLWLDLLMALFDPNWRRCFLCNVIVLWNRLKDLLPNPGWVDNLSKCINLISSLYLCVNSKSGCFFHDWYGKHVYTKGELNSNQLYSVYKYWSYIESCSRRKCLIKYILVTTVSNWLRIHQSYPLKSSETPPKKLKISGLLEMKLNSFWYSSYCLYQE